MTSVEKMANVLPDDLQELLRFSFAAALGKHPMNMTDDERLRWLEYSKKPVPLSVFQRVDHVFKRAVNGVTDEMVEHAAKVLEKTIKQSKYGWTDEQFEIWWNNDSRFIADKTNWGDAFGHGTQKARLLWEARIILEAAFEGIL